MPHFDMTIHLGDVIMSSVGLLASLVGHRLLKAALRFFQRIDTLEGRTEGIASVVDSHSFHLHQLVPTAKFPKLRRRKEDLEVSSV